MSSSIELKDLTTGYVSQKSLVEVTTNLNAHLTSGEMTCLMGPNGAGKSTLLKTLSGFLKPIAGEIILFGKPIQDFNETDLAKLIGVVLTERLSVSNMTAEELVALGRSPYTGIWGNLSSEDHRIVDDSIILTGIENLKKRRVTTLSDGERQKVLIAKTLAQQTPVIFLNEPTAFLDYPSKAEIMLLLRKLANEERKIIFISTHDLELALQIADKAWLLDKEKGISIGTPAELSENGDIGRYFDRKGLFYDKERRIFRVN